MAGSTGQQAQRLINNAPSGPNMNITREAPVQQQGLASSGGKGGSTTQPVPNASAPMQQATTQPAFNIQQAVPQALGRAMQTTAMGTAYQPQQVQGTSYQAPTIGAPTSITPTGYQAAQAGQIAPITAQQVQGTGFQAAQAGQVGPVTAQQIQAGQLASTALSPYVNPYESQVVGQTLSDLERARQMQQNVLGAQATQARAFGGSRAGVAQAETNRAFAEQAARTAGQLRQAGFTQAQQAAQQDIASQLAAQQANQQAALQAGISGAGIARDIGLANLQAQQQARQFGAQQGMQAALANQQAALQAGTTTAGLQQAINLANQQAQQQARQFGAQQGMTAQQLNQAAGMQRALANQAALQQAGQFGAQQQMAAQLANQQAGLSGLGARMGAAQQLGNLANLGFGMGQTINQQLAQQGMMQQALQQAIIDAGRQQYAGFTGAPTTSLQQMLGAFGGSQTGQQTQTGTYQPGLFDYLSLGANVIGAGIGQGGRWAS